MFALVLQIPNENRTGFSIVHLYKRPRTENTACAKRVRPFAKIRTGESKSKLACILPGGRIFDEVKGTNNSGKAAETGPPEAFFQPNVIFSARKCAKIKNMSIFAVPKQRFWVGRTGQVLLPRPKRRGAGVVDRAALEMRCTGNCTGGSNPSLSARRRSMTANCTETSGYKAGRFSFSGPARCDSRSGFPPHRPHRPRRSHRLHRLRPDRPGRTNRTPGYASNRPVCFGASH